jgi:CDP-2,3-bis-(O-geranylgeranyl)-sn-glycerol synthase
MGGRRLLGDGKTWRGTAFGTLAGVLLAQVLNLAAPVVVRQTGVSLPTFPLAAAVGLALGAMLGDVAASFLKRRTGRERGAAFPGVDQLDFVVGALACAALFDFAWFASTFTLPVLAVVVVLTPILHLATNGIAYALGLKDEPY